MTRFTIKNLESEDRSGFDSGTPELDEYLKQRARQDIRRRISGCYIAVDPSSAMIAGYYTISACHVRLTDLPDAWRKKLPRYPNIPAVLVGRLAVDRRFRGRKIGSGLIVDAATRSMRAEVVVNLMVVDAKDDAATRFYRHHGFVENPDNPKQLFVPLKRIVDALQESGKI